MYIIFNLIFPVRNTKKYVYLYVFHTFSLVVDMSFLAKNVDMSVESFVAVGGTLLAAKRRQTVNQITYP